MIENYNYEAAGMCHAAADRYAVTYIVVQQSLFL